MQCGSAVHFADTHLIEKNPGLQALKEGRGLGRKSLCYGSLADRSLWNVSGHSDRDERKISTEVLEEIGQGVYGAVSRAEHLMTGEVVAIKSLGDSVGTFI